MKFLSSLFTAAFVLLAATTFETASAVECTTEQSLTNEQAMLGILSAPECSKYYKEAKSSSATCVGADCLAVMTKTIGAFPDCLMFGVDAKKTLADTIAKHCPDSAAPSAKTSVMTVAATSVLVVVAMRM